MDLASATHAFRFSGLAEIGLLDLFAVGRQDIVEADYRWDGRQRTDGPLLLFQYTLSGAGLLETNGLTRRVGPGQGFLVRIPSDHVYRIAPEPGRWDILFVLLRPTGAEALWNAAVGRLGEVVDLPVTSGPVEALRDLISAAQAGRIGGPHAASLLVYRFLVELSRFALAPPPPSLPGPIVQALALLEAGCHRPWKLTEVAAQVGLSPSHFHRLFRRHTGLSPLEWLTRRRIEKAVELLGDPDQTVQQVARVLGFADTSYFIKMFHRWTGLTPGALRDSRSVWAGSKILLSAGEFSDVRPSDSPVS